MTNTARTPLISGNWKMYKNHFEAIQLVQKLSYQITSDDALAVDVSVHPPFTDLRSVQTVLEAEEVPIALGAQHCHHKDEGAFTGEVSPAMLAKLNVKLVIAGHSERRELFGETDEVVNAKIRAVVAHAMTPILCVGETLDEREAGGARDKVQVQVTEGLKGLNAQQVGAMVVAYEPIWAIGTGRTATPDDAQEMCAFVRATVQKLHGGDAADTLRVQYGGSVKPGNATELLGQADIDGALVGGASLEADDFIQIVHAAIRG